MQSESSDGRPGASRRKKPAKQESAPDGFGVDYPSESDTDSGSKGGRTPLRRGVRRPSPLKKIVEGAPQLFSTHHTNVGDDIIFLTDIHVNFEEMRVRNVFGDMNFSTASGPKGSSLRDEYRLVFSQNIVESHKMKLISGTDEFEADLTSLQEVLNRTPEDPAEIIEQFEAAIPLFGEKVAVGLGRLAYEGAVAHIDILPCRNGKFNPSFPWMTMEDGQPLVRRKNGAAVVPSMKYYDLVLSTTKKLREAIVSLGGGNSIFFSIFTRALRKISPALVPDDIDPAFVEESMRSTTFSGVVDMLAGLEEDYVLQMKTSLVSLQKEMKSSGRLRSLLDRVEVEVASKYDTLTSTVVNYMVQYISGENIQPRRRQILRPGGKFPRAGVISIGNMRFRDFDVSRMKMAPSHYMIEALRAEGASAGNDSSSEATEASVHRMLDGRGPSGWEARLITH